MPNRPTREVNPHREEAARLARELKSRREDFKLSQQALAVRAGIAIGTVRALESGRTVDPGLFTIINVVRALELRLEDVLDQVLDRTPQE